MRLNTAMERIPGEEDINRVASWLEDLHIDSDSEQDDLEPATPPPRRPFHKQSFDGVSPTDTTFSGGSIFDKPYRQSLLLGSPSPYRDDISDVTSVDGEDASRSSSPSSRAYFHPPTLQISKPPQISPTKNNPRTGLRPSYLVYSAPSPTSRAPAHPRFAPAARATPRHPACFNAACSRTKSPPHLQTCARSLFCSNW
jgi:hypothetical protein